MPRVANNGVGAASQVKAEPAGDVKMSDASNQPAWLKKVKEGAVKKVPKDVQKRRRNFRLARLLIPKPPMMVLMELVKQNEVTFEKFISDPVSRLLKVTASFDGNTFEGVGPTKNIAKNICSESILQYIAFKACQKDAAVDPAHPNQGEEETPWTALASVALFKMFNDWQAQGASIPSELMRGATRGAPTAGLNAADDVTMEDANGAASKNKARAGKPKPPKDKVLPADAASRHPVQLLHEMQGSLDYEVLCEGNPPATIYHTSVTIDGRKFTGSGKNKKDSKKNCAIEAMAGVYSVIYPKEEL